MMSPFGVEHGEISKARYEAFSAIKFANKGTLTKVTNGGPWAKKPGLKTPAHMVRRGVPSESSVAEMKANNKKATVL